MRAGFSDSGAWSSCSTTSTCTRTATLCLLTGVSMVYGGKCELTNSGSTWTLSAGGSPWENGSSMTCAMHCYNLECVTANDCNSGQTCSAGLCK